MAEKVTVMLLKVDLGCSKCYRKVKKILCKFPQVQDQMYDEKNNTVMIKVVSCCPEKIRDKICCKGRGTIRSIEILKPPPPKPPEKPPPKPPEKPPPPPPPKPEEKPPPPPPPKPPAPCPCPCPVPIGCCCTECSKRHGGGPCYNPCYGPPPKPPEKPPPPPPKPEEKPPPPPKPPAPAPCPCPVPIGCCCTECSKGHGGGPCYNPCYGHPPKPAEKPPKPPAPAPGPVPIGCCCTECSKGRGGGPCYGQPVRYYDGYCGRPVYDSWGGGGYRGNYGSRCCEYYFSEDYSQGCTIL